MLAYNNNTLQKHKEFHGTNWRSNRYCINDSSSIVYGSNQYKMHAMLISVAQLYMKR